MTNILLAEKDRETRNLFMKLLKKEGYDVIEVSDGNEAIEQYEKSEVKPELIILGYRLPKKNGLEVMQELLAQNPSCNILLITGDPKIDNQKLSNGNVSFKTKPVSRDDFLKTIHKIVQT